MPKIKSGSVAFYLARPETEQTLTLTTPGLTTSTIFQEKPLRARRNKLKLFMTIRADGWSAYDTIRYDTRCYFNVRSKAGMSQLNLGPTARKPTTKKWKTEKLKSKKRICSQVSVNSQGNPWSQSGRRKGRLRWERFAEKGGLRLERKSEGLMEY